MADELIDRYDEDGIFLETIMKSEAHKIGAWHKSIHLYLVNGNNEVLLQQRAEDKKLYPNAWDISVGGHVGAGEDTLTSAIRELKEELGIDAKPNELKFLFTTKEVLIQGDFVSKEFVDVFIVKKDVKKEDIKLQDEEVADFKFVKICDFLKLIENNDDRFIPHDEEYEKMKEYFKKSELGKLSNTKR